MPAALAIATDNGKVGNRFCADALRGSVCTHASPRRAAASKLSAARLTTALLKIGVFKDAAQDALNQFVEPLLIDALEQLVHLSLCGIDAHA